MQLGGNERVCARARGDGENLLGGDNVVKSAPVQLPAPVRRCRVKQYKKVEGKEGWMRIVFCLHPVTLSLEGALEAALRLQKGVRKHGPAPKRSSRPRRVEAPGTDAGEVERLARQMEAQKGCRRTKEPWLLLMCHRRVFRQRGRQLLS